MPDDPPKLLRMSRRYTVNLVLIALIGVATSIWVMAYTDFFEIIGGLLGLGGALTWIAFMSKLMPEGRLLFLQEQADKVFGARRTLAVCVLVLAAEVIVLGGFVGCFRVVSAPGEPDRMVQVYRNGSKEPEYVRLAAGQELRMARWTSWRNPNEFIIRAKGYPPMTQTLRPLHRDVITIPGSFSGPIVLLRPTIKLKDQVHFSPATLIIKQEEKEIGVYSNYMGQTLWIGSDGEVDVPNEVLGGWRSQLEIHQRPQYLKDWAIPETIGEPTLRLNPRDGIEVVLKDANMSIISTKKIVVRKPSQGFLIEEVLYEKE
jgi:hypothetical protein